MAVEKLTQEEATRLLEMLKRSVDKAIAFPSLGNRIEFDVVGDTKKDLFTISVFHSYIRQYKYYFGARIKKNGTMLLELDINPTGVHINPDGSKIVGNHWHVYTEEYGRDFAYPAEDIANDEFIENTILFLERFHVVERPEIQQQTEMV